MSVPGLVERTKNAIASTSAALVTSLPVRARPCRIASGVELAVVVRLAHAREHEDLVVHREPVEEREDHQRDPRDDRVRRRHVPDRLGAVALLEDEDDDPVGGAERDRGSGSPPSAAGAPSGTRASAGCTSARSRTAARTGSCRRPRARSRAPRARRRRASRAGRSASASAGSTSCCRFEITGRTSFAAPSCAGIASTIAAPAVRHCGGAAAPTTPGVEPTFARDALERRPASRCPRRGSRTACRRPAGRPPRRARRARRPRRPPPGRSFACASLGLSWTP